MSAAPDSPLREAARRFAHRPALTDGPRRWTFAELDALVDRVAGGLAAALPRGERVALLMQNCAEYVVAQLAIERAALVRVPINARTTPIETGKLLADCEAALVLCDESTQASVRKALERPDLAARAIEVGDAQWAALETAAPIEADLAGGDLDAIASINYTSGSSGEPKGVVLTFRQWRAVYKNMLIDRKITADDIVAHIGPLTHAAGTYVTPCLLRGARNVIVPAGDIERLFGKIERLRVTGFTCVPTVLTRIINHPARANYDLSSLNWIGYGAEPVPVNTITRAIEIFGPILTQNYGLTEAMMTCSFLGPQDHLRADGSIRTGSIGRPYTFVDIVLRSPDGRAVAAGEVGEITIRAEHVMQGYWRRPDVTSATLRDGWLWSGDLARWDSDGFLYLTGRSKEMIISGGFNIYPQELERHIGAHPAVEECAVVGIPDAQFGEAAIAFVAARASEHLDAAALREYCKAELGIRTPRYWRVLDAIPKNPNGKIDKAALRRLAQDGPR